MLDHSKIDLTLKYLFGCKIDSTRSQIHIRVSEYVCIILVCTYVRTFKKHLLLFYSFLSYAYLVLVTIDASYEHYIVKKQDTQCTNQRCAIV